MIRSKDLNEDLKGLEVKLLKASAKAEKEQSDEVTNADIVKAIVLVAKVIRDIRTNQVSWMKQEYGDKAFIKARRQGKPDDRDGKVEKTEGKK